MKLLGVWGEATCYLSNAQFRIIMSSEDSREKQKLNWISLLYDENIFIDSEAFRNWDHNLDFEGSDTLKKDLLRTRSSEPFFQKESTLKNLELVATFYCKFNGVNYQQGLLEVIIPFVLFQRRDFELRKCYAYFNAFMRKIFPKILMQRMVGDKKELPHVLSAITLCEVLLKFHSPDIFYILKRNEIFLSMVVTQWLITLFAQDTKIPLVYLIYDYFIKKRNKNTIFYMAVGLIISRREAILQAETDDCLHKFLNKQLKAIDTPEELEQWIKQSEELQKNTPESFEMLTKRIGFSEKSILSQEDFASMMQLDQYITDLLLPIYPSDLQTPNSFYMLCVDVLPLTSDSCRVGQADLNKNFKDKLPKKKVLVLVVQDIPQHLQFVKVLVIKLHKEGFTRIGLLNGTYDKLSCALI